LAYRSHDVRLAWFLSAATDPTVRREGIAAAVSTALFERLSQAGVERVRMTTSQEE
jgi:ribosomal protein S18 acetylase RimI-like enzyme